MRAGFRAPWPSPAKVRAVIVPCAAAAVANVLVLGAAAAVRAAFTPNPTTAHGSDSPVAPTPSRVPATPPPEVPRSAAPLTPEVPVAAAPRSVETERQNIERRLQAWIAATNAGDLRGQMTFYAPRLRTFYLSHDVSRAAVRAEKTRVFRDADVVDIRAGAPDITFSDDASRAVTRFEKRYVISGRRARRAGAVVQELEWVKTGGDWKIVSERDVRVLDPRTGASG